jgi:virginiamycin B lyase
MSFGLRNTTRRRAQAARRPAYRPRLEPLEDRCVPSVSATEFPITTPGSAPLEITLGADGNLWFTEFAGNNIARITPAGTVTEFTVPTPNSGPVGIVSGPDGNVWFTEQNAGKIGHLNPLAGNNAAIQASVTEAVIPAANAVPQGITAGPDGALWFTESGANNIGRITTANVITNEYPVKTPMSNPVKITAGPDGALWFTESVASQIGRITTAGVVTEFGAANGITPKSFPNFITAGPDGNLWFTEAQGNRIGKITTAGAATEFALPAGRGTPAGITTGPDGALWFTESSTQATTPNQLGRITVQGGLQEFSQGISPASGLEGITVGADGALWFTELQGNRIGRLLPLQTQASPTQFPVGLGAGGSGTAPVVNLQNNGQPVSTANVFPGFSGEVRVASGDFGGSGDSQGIPDSVFAAGPGGGPEVKVIDGKSGATLAAFFAFAPTFTGGVSVAVGDVNGDGNLDIIVGAGPGGGPEVKVIDGTKMTQLQANGEIAPSALLADFFAFAPSFSGGVTVAAADVNGDTKADVIGGAGPGGGPEVKVISGAKVGQLQANGQIAPSALLTDFFAYAPSFSGGVWVAAGDYNGDGIPDVVVGAGAGGGPEVKVINGTQLGALQGNGEIGGSLLADFFAYAPNFTGGVRVGAVESNRQIKAGQPLDLMGEIVTGAGPGGGPQVNVYRGDDGSLLDAFFATAASFTGGVFV